MKNAIAVGIAGVLFVVVWISLWFPALEEETIQPTDPAECRDGDSCPPQALEQQAVDPPVTLPGDVPSAAASTPAKSATLSNGMSAERVYGETCATCHVAGLGGAPKFGDREVWAPRIARGMDALYLSSIEGVPPAMPARGMCFDCSDDDLKAVVDYMVSHSR